MVFHSLALFCSILSHQQISPQSQMFTAAELASLTTEVKLAVEAMGPNDCIVKPLVNRNDIDNRSEISLGFIGGFVEVDSKSRLWRTISMSRDFLKPLEGGRTIHQAREEAERICVRVFGNDPPTLHYARAENEKISVGIAYKRDGHLVGGDMGGHLTFRDQHQGAWYFRRPIRPKRFRNSPLRLTKPEALANAKTIANQLAQGEWQLAYDFDAEWDVPNFKERGLAFGLDYRTQADIEDGESDTARLVYHVFFNRENSGRGISFAHVILDATTGEKLFVSRF